MNDKPNYYSILPATVRYDSTLKDKAKLLYSEITSLTYTNGECWASNEYFARLFNISISTVKRMMTELKNKNYIDISYIKDEKGQLIIQRIIKIIGGFKIEPTGVQNCAEGGFKIEPENNKYINNNRKEINKEKKELFINILNESNLSENMKLSLNTWLNYKEDRNDLYKSEVGFRKLISIINNQLKEHSEEELIDLIDESIANNYKGITFNKLKYNPRNNFNNSTPTTVNDDGVFRIL